MGNCKKQRFGFRNVWVLALLLKPNLFFSWLHGFQNKLYTDSKRRSPVYAVRNMRMMFSGIVEEMGRVSKLEDKDQLLQWDGTIAKGTELKVLSDGTVLEGAFLGASIAVNGVCLTVIEYDGQSFTVGLAPETLRRTNLPYLKPGDKVNLERALPVDGRNSGHFVQGHVDATGDIVELKPDGDSLWVKVKVPPELIRYIVPKGFIAVDGTSLTVCEVDTMACCFNFMLVAYTQKHIIIPLKSVGDKVNIEVDILGKYVERSMGSILERLDSIERKLASL